MEQSGAGSIAEFHLLGASEPEVQVIMRKQDAACPLPILGLVLTQPQDLWSGIACAHRVPDERDDAGRAAEMIGDLISLAALRCVVPHLASTHHPPLPLAHVPTSFLHLTVYPHRMARQFPKEINLARFNLPVALTLGAPATQPLKQSDIGGCSASVTPRMTKIVRRAGPFP